MRPNPLKRCRAGLLLLGWWIGQGSTIAPAMARPFELSECPEVLVVLEDPVEPDGSVGPKVAEIACEKLAELAPKFGRQLTGKVMVRLMIADDPEAFFKHTGRNMFTQAVYSSRKGIITQPAKAIRRMARHKSLEGLLAHELTHFLVNETVGHRCPVWLNEGLAQWFEKRPTQPGGPTDERQLAKLELLWRSAAPYGVRQRCYSESLALTARLIAAVGEEALLQALPAMADLDDPLALPIGKKSLRAWLFPDAVPAATTARDPDDEIEITRGTGGPRHDDDGGGPLTPLPIDDMLKKAKAKKKRKSP